MFFGKSEAVSGRPELFVLRRLHLRSEHRCIRRSRSVLCSVARLPVFVALVGNPVWRSEDCREIGGKGIFLSAHTCRAKKKKQNKNSAGCFKELVGIWDVFLVAPLRNEAPRTTAGSKSFLIPPFHDTITSRKSIFCAISIW